MVRLTNKLKSQQWILGKKTNDSTKYLFACFRLLGVLMPEKHKLLYVVYSVIVNTLSLIILPLSFTLSYLMDIENMPLNQLLTSLQIGINVYACVIKFIIMFFMKSSLFKIKAILDKIDDQIEHPDEVYEKEKVVKFCHRMVILFCVIYYSYSVTTFLGAIYSGHPPYSLYNPIFDWRTSKWTFTIESLIEFAMINIACLQNAANDSFAVVHIRILQTQINILIKKISRIGVDRRTTQEDNLKQLIHCIRNHGKLIELCEAIAAVISLTVFVQFMTSSAAIGISLINIRAFGDRSTIIGCVFLIGSLIWELLPMCYLVNCLVADAERLPDAIFHLNWMDQSKAFQQNCIFFMHRSQKSMEFYAGKVFPISLNSFIAIIKFSFSFCTLLSTMDLAARFN